MAFKFGRITKDNNVTPEAIKHMVSKEINAASAQSRMMKYFDNIAASSERAETILMEIKDSIDDNDEKMKELQQLTDSIKDMTVSCENLESLMHKDNLITYKNIKEQIEAVEEENDTRIRKLGRRVTFMTIIGILCLAGIIVLLANSFGLI